MSECANPLPAACAVRSQNRQFGIVLSQCRWALADVLLPIKKRKRVTPVALKYILILFCY